MEVKQFPMKIQYYLKLLLVFSFAAILFVSCSKEDAEIHSESTGETKTEPVTPEVVAVDVRIEQRAKKIEQLTGDIDRHLQEPTRNQTFSRYGLKATDLGVPVYDGETTFILFGDTWGTREGLPNTIAYTKDDNPDDGLALDFVTDDHGIYNPLTVPGISQNAFEVPTEGVFIDGQMYLYHTTDHSEQNMMGRSVLARSNNDGYKTFEYLYDYSVSKFINISVVKVNASKWNGLPQDGSTEGLITFGSGKYRQSKLFLLYQPSKEIENPDSRKFFAGVDEDKNPVWESHESKAKPLFNMPEDCIGEFSVSYNQYINKWILLYNCGNPRGINLRTADKPWGPWTKSQILFEPWEDGGYCNFIHVNWEYDNCDNTHDPGRENKWGGEYGPYQFEHMARDNGNSTTIYFTLSTWNPYTVVLMKSTISNL